MSVIIYIMGVLFCIGIVGSILLLIIFKIIYGAPPGNERIERALVLPTDGGSNSFVDELDPTLERK